MYLASDQDLQGKFIQVSNIERDMLTSSLEQATEDAKNIEGDALYNVVYEIVQVPANFHTEDPVYYVKEAVAMVPAISALP